MVGGRVKQKKFGFRISFNKINSIPQKLTFRELALPQRKYTLTKGLA